MRSIRYALVVTAIVGAVVVLLTSAGQAVVTQAVPGEELPLAARLTLWAGNQSAIWLPILLPLVIGAAALAGAWRLSAIVAWAFAQLHAIIYAGVIVIGLGTVAFVAAWLFAVHLQRRLEANGSRLRAWHVALATGVGWFFGPLAFVPPAVVWWNSRRA